jgi:1-deoxy-D-xylulose-5-phosphate reductoisomerase
MPDPQRTRRLVVLGSTGSIGVNTLRVVEHLNASGPARIEVVGLAACRGGDLLAQQARTFRVPAVALAETAGAEPLRRALPGVRVYAGPDAALELMEAADATDACAAVVGSAGLPATLAAARKGLTIGLANKETLVAAGALVAPAVRRGGATLIPVDSEHSAIFQCLEGRARGNPEAVKRIVLTASGGPFRTADKAAMRDATPDEALRHPTWKMGPKITIDSATMMNKALEIVEAHYLFDLPAEKIEVIVHPQSVVHSFVEFMDNSVLAQLGPPDMKTPIQYALTYPDRPAGCSAALDWSKLRKLDFEPPDHDRFRSLRLAYEVIEAGGTAGAVFNAANEAAVAAFLERRIRFGRNVELVAEALSAIEPRPVDALETVLAADREARGFVESRVGSEALAR